MLEVKVGKANYKKWWNMTDLFCIIGVFDFFGGCKFFVRLIVYRGDDSTFILKAGVLISVVEGIRCSCYYFSIIKY